MSDSQVPRSRDRENLSNTNLLSVQRHPPAESRYSWADFVELLCLVNPDKMVSLSDIHARIVKQRELGEESPIEDTEESTPSNGPIVAVGDEPTVSSMQESGRASEHDDAVRSIRGWFDYIQARQEQFGELYPYTFDSTTNTIHLKRMSTRRKLYIFLLVSSNLENFTDDSAKKAFRNHFELVCKVALKEYLPKPANVHLFGTNPLNRGKYRGRTWERVSKLADDINETLKAREEDFSRFSSGDRGLDLVAWIPHKDSAGGKAIFFAQCGTGDNWEVKQNDTRYDGRWRRIIDCVEQRLLDISGRFQSVGHPVEQGIEEARGGVRDGWRIVGLAGWGRRVR